MADPASHFNGPASNSPPLQPAPSQRRPTCRTSLAQSVMSQSSSPYPPHSPFYPNPQTMNASLNTDTPPPPPPKPSSHEASRGGTPQNASSSSMPPTMQPHAQVASRTDMQPSDTPQGPHPTHAQQTTLPDPPSVEEGWLPDMVKDKSTTDLHTILSKPSLLSALSSKHPSQSSRQHHLESLIQANKDLTKRVQSLQTHLNDLRSSTEQMLLTHQSLEVSWRKKQAEMDAALAPWSPKALYQRLSAAIAEQEAVCRAVEESFLEGDHFHHHHHHNQQLQFQQQHSDGRFASEKEIADWVRRVRAEATKLAARKEGKARWDEGRVGGWR